MPVTQGACTGCNPALMSFPLVAMSQSYAA